MIHPETGRNIAPYSAHPEEEVLFPSGVVFKVVGRVKTDPNAPQTRRNAGFQMYKNRWNPDPQKMGVDLIILKEIPNYTGPSTLLPPPPPPRREH